MVINYAESYQQALANAFPKALHFGALWRTENASKYKKIDAKTVKIPLLDVTGRVDGDRSKITGPSVRHSLDWESKNLEQHRTWDTLVHPVDVNQTNMVLTISQITKTYNEQQKFKEMDCYTSSKLYSNFIKQGGVANTKALTTENILAYIDEVMEAMDEAFVPASGRILYVTSHVNTLIKNAKNLSRVRRYGKRDQAHDRARRRTVYRESAVISYENALRLYGRCGACFECSANRYDVFASRCGSSDTNLFYFDAHRTYGIERGKVGILRGVVRRYLYS